MRITIAHYHLNPGGVTRIIESQVKSLLMMSPGITLTVICGGWSEKSFTFSDKVTLKVFPELNYLENKEYAQGELDEAYQTINNILGAEAEQADVFHFHNATLGKNPLISISLYQLAQQGKKVINHAHDFAEDRPLNLSFMQDVIGNHFQLNVKEVMYPEMSNYIFGVINSSDERRVISYGFEKHRLHKWLNPVSVPQLPEGVTKKASRERLIEDLNLASEKAIVSYPVRVIRRKNIGEFLLLGWYFANEASFLVTQPPNNPVEKVFYDKWVSFAKEKEIAVVFEAGQKADFVDVMMGSDFCITTSIMEGFGMVFVEPWFWGTPVKGRAIPAVMDDLTGSGIDFPYLYDEIMVEYKDEIVDFASLNYDEQTTVISKYIKTGRASLKALNPTISRVLDKVNPAIVAGNAKALSASLSEENYGRNLFKLYKTLS